MNALVASVIRTIVPAAVGQVGAWLLLVNVVMPSTVATALTTFLGFALTAIYYVGVRVIEQQWPSFGVLLGLPSSPDTYSKATVTAAVPAAPTSGPVTVNYAATPADTAEPADVPNVTFSGPVPSGDVTAATVPDLATPAVAPAQ